ncbi:hypothetical protein N473_00590 [Pseudoalteromonas luteoviolacea CPMOR-1]|uniref:Transketolase N-terminal domain-containing protein n=1 Tax=Pseudoalteromonas luteoviolacea CPMOR-1 TaxID=1365248 RepID=A0A162BPD9_9GAMM|nr:transketolase [Pseudoalteromonas luteoviolacea]KZN65097.1 hypothetical protein N473_00590 [Pseudoalteromonas luteoviolacea CPMOR-1]
MNQDLRKRIAEIIYQAKEGHIPSSYSIVDIINHLYTSVLSYDSNNPTWEKRDYFILSKGHGCAALWVVLEKLNLLPERALEQYSQFGGILGGHPDRTKVPFVEASTGSLGHGMPMAVGCALAHKITGNDNKVFCLVGDGECHEGTIWESAHVATNRNLNNLTVIVDWNQSAAQLCPTDDLPAKWRSFGWHTVVFDGHNQAQIEAAFNENDAQAPTVLIAKNVKGKGVSMTEGHGPWHHKIPSKEELEHILEALS